MHVAVAILGLALIGLILLDGFESIILPRRVGRRLRPARIYYVATWIPWRAIGRHIRGPKFRGTFLAWFGPASMLGLLGLWALSLITGFAILLWAVEPPMRGLNDPGGFGPYFYFSGVTFFTLGYGDLTPSNAVGRALAVAETGIGYGFLAVVIGYLPVLYGAFSRREASISLLDARAGSPPSAIELIRRLSASGSIAPLDGLLQEWERWSAELLETHISFPVLAYYRSQHDNQSWLAALTAVLDTCAIVMAGLRGVNPYHAGLTFAVARHAVVDIALVFNTRPHNPEHDRMPPECFAFLRETLTQTGHEPRESPEFEQKLAELRAMYEPFVNALAHHFQFTLPAFKHKEDSVDNWQTSAWMRRVPGFTHIARARDDHFD
jgi:hypothetical protein